MKAIHLKTVRLKSEAGVERLKRAIGTLAGVSSVAVVRSAGVISVLFDETMASADQILRAIRSAGFDARPFLPAP